MSREARREPAKSNAWKPTKREFQERSDKGGKLNKVRILKS